MVESLLFFMEIRKSFYKDGFTLNNLRFLPVLILLLMPSCQYLVDGNHDLSEKDKIFSIPGEKEYISDHYGLDYFELYTWMNSNLNKTDRVLTFFNLRLYIECELYFAESYTVKETYFTDDLEDGLENLNSNSISFVLVIREDKHQDFKIADWSFLINNSVIFSNLGDEEHFKLIYSSESFELYEII